VAIARHAALSVNRLADVEFVVDDLIACAVRIALLHRPVVVIIVDRYHVSFAICYGVNSACGVIAGGRGGAGRRSGHRVQATAPVIGERRRFTLRIGLSQRLALAIVGQRRHLTRRIGDRQRLVLAVIGQRAQDILAGAIHSAHLQQVDSVRVVGVVGRSPERVHTLRDHALSVIGGKGSLRRPAI
jgi:hypothetical protein